MLKQAWHRLWEWLHAAPDQRYHPLFGITLWILLILTACKLASD